MQAAAAGARLSKARVPTAATNADPLKRGKQATGKLVVAVRGPMEPYWILRGLIETYLTY